LGGLCPPGPSLKQPLEGCPQLGVWISQWGEGEEEKGKEGTLSWGVQALFIITHEALFWGQ